MKINSLNCLIQKPSTSMIIANFSSHPRCELRLKPLYALGSSMCSFVIPAAMMILLYTRLYLFARKHAKIMRTQLHQAANFTVTLNACEGIRNVFFLNFSAKFHFQSFSIPYDNYTSDMSRNILI